MTVTDEADAWQRRAGEKFLQPLPADSPRLAQHASALELQDVEGHERHVSARLVALREHRLNPFMTVTLQRFSVEGRRDHRPGDLPQPRHASVSEEIEPTADVTGDDTALADVELGPLTVELRLGDVPATPQARQRQWRARTA